jgi:hypothetical protein
MEGKDNQPRGARTGLGQTRPQSSEKEQASDTLVLRQETAPLCGSAMQPGALSSWQGPYSDISCSLMWTGGQGLSPRWRWLAMAWSLVCL